MENRFISAKNAKNLLKEFDCIIKGFKRDEPDLSNIINMEFARRGHKDRDGVVSPSTQAIPVPSSKKGIPDCIYVQKEEDNRFDLALLLYALGCILDYRLFLDDIETLDIPEGGAGDLYLLRRTALFESMDPGPAIDIENMLGWLNATLLAIWLDERDQSNCLDAVLAYTTQFLERAPHFHPLQYIQRTLDNVEENLRRAVQRYSNDYMDYLYCIVVAGKFGDVGIRMVQDHLLSDYSKNNPLPQFNLMNGLKFVEKRFKESEGYIPICLPMKLKPRCERFPEVTTPA